MMDDVIRRAKAAVAKMPEWRLRGFDQRPPIAFDHPIHGGEMNTALLKLYIVNGDKFQGSQAVAASSIEEAVQIGVQHFGERRVSKVKYLTDVIVKEEP